MVGRRDVLRQASIATGTVLSLGSAASAVSAASFEDGQSVVTTAEANYYWNGTWLGTIEAETTGTIQGHGSTYNGYKWWVVEFETGDVGWVKQSKLDIDSGDRTGAAHREAAGNQSLAGSGSLIENVPYMSQYNNDRQPYASCQNTSLAMLLAYYGWSSADPDKITKWDGTDAAKTPAGAARVFDLWSDHLGLGVRAKGYTSTSYADLEWFIDQGRPAMVNTWMTDSGHLVTVVGYTDSEVICNDPAGVWNERYYGDHSGSDGAYVRYDKSAFRNVAAPPNGTGNVFMAVPERPR